MKINEELKKYIEENIFPEYQKNDVGHGIEHIKYVINRSFKFAETVPDINYDMVYTIAAYHDIGYPIDRKKHEIISGEIMSKDENLKKFFSEEQLKTIKEAIEDHRASNPNVPRNLYGKILASADKNIYIDQFFKRSYEYGLEHYKELTTEEQLQRIYEHAEKKFGKNGYAISKYYVEDKKYFDYLKELQNLIDNKEEFFKKCKEVLNLR